MDKLLRHRQVRLTVGSCCLGSGKVSTARQGKPESCGGGGETGEQSAADASSLSLSIQQYPTPAQMFVASPRNHTRLQSRSSFTVCEKKKALQSTAGFIHGR